MVEALRRHVEQLLQTNEHYARVGCAVADLFRYDLDPDLFGRFQDEWLRPLLKETENRLQSFRRQRARRDALHESRVARRPELGRKLGDHQQLLYIRREVLHQRRRILRQIGDAIAWIACGMRPRILVPLSAEDQTHHLPSGLGGFGNVAARRMAHTAGGYIVVENDLTRCLGIGDLTVVSLEAIGSHRTYGVEVKTRGELAEGEEVRIDFILATGDGLAEDEAFLDDFTEVIGARTGASDQDLTERGEQQVEKLVERTRLMREGLGRIGATVGWPQMRHLGSVVEVVRRAELFGRGWDQPEPGLLYGAVERATTEDFGRVIQRSRDEAERAGFPLQSEALVFATSDEFGREARGAAHLTPIALWPLPRGQRTKILSEKIIFYTWFDSNRWDEAFERSGLTRREEEGHWIVESPEGETVTLDRLEVAVTTASVLFSGASPDDLVERLAQAFV